MNLHRTARRGATRPISRQSRPISRQSRPTGFTLVEILIVVIILGILAAIVIPQFTSASEDARKNSLTSQLQTLRSQVELYKLQHRDMYPTADGEVGSAWAWTKLTGTTDASGSTTGTGFGPYLQSTPVNGLNGETAMGKAAAASTGFVIDANGKIFATGRTATNYFHEGDGTESTTAPAGFTAHAAS